MGKKRAITEDERAERRRRIVDATATLLKRWSPDDVNVDRVAALAGIAKGTVYLYFRTREELVLEVIDWHHGLWLDTLAAQLRENRAPLTPDAAARLTVSTLLGDPLLVGLYGQIGAILGGSVSPEAVHRFRLRRSDRIAATALALESRLHGVRGVEAARWLLRVEAFAAGIAPLARLSKAVGGTFADADPAGLPLDLESELQYVAVTMLLSP